MARLGRIWRNHWPLLMSFALLAWSAYITL